ncbi:peptide ABC transporter ATP-binding protein [Saccharobesus litoralis]|uniref:Peptide ABC transporter ATP-binding protein n=1 Tax=Saccharobesus litoralis TaxID=2172099 RepID=A0A2S0VSC9_9ALTE|nr:ATP-binding cassette domain-containing protein [Saccharobesus litoralis]AWB67093.1 peptide ABC transporter ATP-binding protein [Saccharobesus litoralis]
MSKLLDVVELSKSYEKRTLPWKKESKIVLDKVSFSLDPFQTLAIVGEAGSGKSVLAKLLAGAEKPSSGKIYLNGQKLDTKNFKHRSRHIRMIFQDPATSLNPSIPIGQMLEEPLKLNTLMSPKEREDKIKKTLGRVGLLPDYMWFYPHMLSSGQKQRVALARALILDPKVIIADKPFAAMDPSTRSQMVNLFLELQQTFGLTYIFVSHNLNIVKHISDYVFIMSEGKVVERGLTSEVFSDPRHNITRKLLYSQQMLKVS